jgi:hypothetical protein
LLCVARNENPFYAQRAKSITKKSDRSWNKEEPKRRALFFLFVMRSKERSPLVCSKVGLGTKKSKAIQEARIKTAKPSYPKGIKRDVFDIKNGLLWFLCFVVFFVPTSRSENKPRGVVAITL